MLSPNEFTVGYISEAKPFSLILPTSSYDETFLVGRVKGAAVAVFLTGDHKSVFIEVEGNTQWQGLIIPNVRVELDETSVSTESTALSMTRNGAELTVTAKAERPFRRESQVVLQSGLRTTGKISAFFNKWQIVLGEGLEKRTLWESK